MLITGHTQSCHRVSKSHLLTRIIVIKLKPTVKNDIFEELVCSTVTDRFYMNYVNLYEFNIRIFHKDLLTASKFMLI